MLWFGQSTNYQLLNRMVANCCSMQRAYFPVSQSNCEVLIEGDQFSAHPTSIPSDWILISYTGTPTGASCSYVVFCGLRIFAAIDMPRTSSILTNRAVNSFVFPLSSTKSPTANERFPSFIRVDTPNSLSRSFVIFNAESAFVSCPNLSRKDNSILLSR